MESVTTFVEFWLSQALALCKQIADAGHVLVKEYIDNGFETGQPNRTAMDEEDLRSYREAVIRGPFHPFFGGDKGLAQAQQ